MEWWQITILSSFASALYTTMNGRFKVAGNTLVFGRSGLVALAMMPFMFFMEWPTDPLFYIFAVGVGVFSGFGDMVRFNCVAQYGGAVISRLNPLKIWIVFVFWMLVSPSTFFDLWADPWVFFAVCAVIFSAGISLMFLNRCPVSGQALLVFLPAILLQSCADMMFKGAVIHHDAGGFVASFQFVFIVTIMMTLVAAFNLYRKGQPLKQDKKTFYVSLLGGVLFFIIVAVLAFAYRDAPNPSYVAAVHSLSVVWIYLYHRIMNIPDKSNVFAGMLFVASTVGLVLLTK